MNDNLRPTGGAVIPFPLRTAPAASGFRAVLRVFWTWYERRRQRLHLGRLADYQLDDIGLSREEASRVAEARFWRS